MYTGPQSKMFYIWFWGWVIKANLRKLTNNSAIFPDLERCHFKAHHVDCPPSQSPGSTAYAQSQTLEIYSFTNIKCLSSLYGNQQVPFDMV